MIVSDATILITLINIDEFELLKLFSKNIIITNEVYNEVSQKEYAKKYIDSEIEQNFIRIKELKSKKLFNELNLLLDKGESASIALSLQENLPLIIDEKKGRKFAKNLGVEVIGLIGIIRFLYLQKIINKARVLEIIDKLNNSNFRVSSGLLEMILQG